MIRKYSKQDFEKVVEMDLNSNHPFYLEKKLSETEIIDWLKKTLSSKEQEFFVYEENGKILGAVAWTRHFFAPQSCELTYLGVHKDFHGKGIGTKLIQWTENLAKEGNFRSIYLYTGVINKKAQQFYLKRGYAEYAKLPDHYSWGDDAILFRKKLR